MADIDTKKLYDELRALRQEVDYIKKHMITTDTIMTVAEAKRFDVAMQEVRARKTTSLASMKKLLRS